eukprot:2206600-Amphidinium_carterae.1
MDKNYEICTKPSKKRNIFKDVRLCSGSNLHESVAVELFDPFLFMLESANPTRVVLYIPDAAMREICTAICHFKPPEPQTISKK